MVSSEIHVKETIKYVVHASNILRLDNSNNLLYNLHNITLQQLQKVMNAAARIVTLTPRDGSATAALKKLHLSPIKSRIGFKVLSITYKALNNQA